MSKIHSPIKIGQIWKCNNGEIITIVGKFFEHSACYPWTGETADGIIKSFSRFGEILLGQTNHPENLSKLLATKDEGVEEAVEEAVEEKKYTITEIHNAYVSCADFHEIVIYLERNDNPEYKEFLRLKNIFEPQVL